MNCPLHSAASVVCRSPWKVLSVVGVLCAAVLGVVTMVALAPEPDPVPRRWQLSIEPGPLRLASVEIPNEGTRAYYFMTYKVTNTTDQDLLFAPAFELANDDGEVLRSGREVPAEVTKDVLGRLESPFIQDQITIVGTLLQGEANAKEGVVIWPVTNTHPREITVYAAGFSGETRGYETKNADGTVNRILLRKTLMMSFTSPGELKAHGTEPIGMSDKRWVMR